MKQRGGNIRTGQGHMGMNMPNGQRTGIPGQSDTPFGNGSAGPRPGPPMGSNIEIGTTHIDPGPDGGAISTKGSANTRGRGQAYSVNRPKGY